MWSNCKIYFVTNSFSTSKLQFDWLTRTILWRTEFKISHQCIWFLKERTTRPNFHILERLRINKGSNFQCHNTINLDFINRLKRVKFNCNFFLSFIFLITSSGSIRCSSSTLYHLFELISSLLHQFPLEVVPPHTRSLLSPSNISSGLQSPG